MWHEGRFELDGSVFRYKVKTLPDGYSGGVDGGRICKLWILPDTEDEYEATYDPIAYYDAGWIERPRNKIGKKAVEHALNLFK